MQLRTQHPWGGGVWRQEMGVTECSWVLKDMVQGRGERGGEERGVSEMDGGLGREKIWQCYLVVMDPPIGSQ